MKGNWNVREREKELLYLFVKAVDRNSRGRNGGGGWEGS
jgi:hypothetical protein